MSDDDERPARRTRSRGRVIGVLAVVAFLVVGACFAGMALARRSFFRYAVRAALAGRGISCGDGFDVTPDAAFAHATIAPCTCTLAQGPVASVELIEALTVDLEGERVTHVHAGHLRAAMRDTTTSVEAGSLGPIASLLGVGTRIGGLVGAASHLASLSAPAIEIPTLDVTQGGRTTVTVDALTLDGHTPLAIAAREVTLPALTGPLGASANVTIDALTGTATASEVHLEGDLALNGTAPLIGPVTRSGRVTVTGTGLDGDAPTYRIEL